MNIRLFSYLYLQDSFHDLEWPFQDISLHSIRASVPEEILEESYKRSFTKIDHFIFYMLFCKQESIVIIVWFNQNPY